MYDESIDHDSMASWKQLSKGPYIPNSINEPFHTTIRQFAPSVDGVPYAGKTSIKCSLLTTSKRPLNTKTQECFATAPWMMHSEDLIPQKVPSHRFDHKLMQNYTGHF